MQQHYPQVRSSQITQAHRRTHLCDDLVISRTPQKHASRIVTVTTGSKSQSLSDAGKNNDHVRVRIATACQGCAVVCLAMARLSRFFMPSLRCAFPAAPMLLNGILRIPVSKIASHVHHPPRSVLLSGNRRHASSHSKIASHVHHPEKVTEDGDERNRSGA